MNEVQPAGAPAADTTTESVGSPSPETREAPQAKPISAGRAAALQGDFNAFHASETAKRRGEPLPDVPAPVAAKPGGEGAADASKPVSNRQAKINEYERTIADLRSQLERSGSAAPAAVAARPAQSAAAVVPAVVEPPAETRQQAYKRYMAMPDAPKIEDFDSVAEHTFAVMDFGASVRAEEQAAREQTQGAELEQRTRTEQRFTKFQERLHEAKTADPTFVEGLSADARNLHGFELAKQKGEEPAPRHFIGELAYDSKYVADFLQHISANPEVYAELQEMPAEIQALPAHLRVKAHMQHIEQEFRYLEGSFRAARKARDIEAEAASAVDPRRKQSGQPSTISAAPPPAPTLGRAGRSGDPSASAVARNDFRAFHEAELAKVQRKRRGVSA